MISAKTKKTACGRYPKRNLSQAALAAYIPANAPKIPAKKPSIAIGINENAKFKKSHSSEAIAVPTAATIGARRQAATVLSRPMLVA